MGQQQLLLIILGVIIVGIAIAVGISQFGANSTQANKDGITSGVISIAANAYQYKIRPTSLGGGGNSYLYYGIPAKMQSEDNGTYSIGTTNAGSIEIIGTSRINTAWVATCIADDSGKTSITYSGW